MEEVKEVMGVQEETQKKSGSKQMILIFIGIIILVLVSGVVLGSIRNKVDSSIAPTELAVDRNTDGSITYEAESATVTLRGSGMPENWPDDAPKAYEGATFLYAGANNPATGKAGSAVVYTSEVSLDRVIAYYTGSLKDGGWTIEANTILAGMTVITARKDTRLFAAYLATADGKTQVTSGVEFGK